ncbi:F-box protein At4g00755-like [Andrographis paniculata]|uniref:F-box protein At4g00755-like n=1 Tax=Andrographis paniculata TaxID=175694 RepID=UPI0021E87C10|nr:F-box protein At4g00755-like [Andrographis paniculata]XP_051123325.1 F-box protein At4g00755-like [Andrographis paniculata]XP_051123334.1 F-box protein At4g00755-like [Andrographis paniculata]
METGIDFVDYLEADVTSNVLAFLNDPLDLLRASSVSRNWRRSVVANGFCKNLWVRKVPQVANIAYAVEESNGVMRLKPSDVLSVHPPAWETLEKEHKIYTSLLQALTKPIIYPKDCISFPIGASSTDREVENVTNTLIPVDRYPWGASYWSSKGHSDPNAPESILYRLNSNICIVSEIDIRPYKVFWEPGKPVYSAKSVRFRMGHPKCLKDWEIKVGPVPQPSADEYVWTYTSPEFPMSQEYCLQPFKLPEPVVCVGGVVQVELFGRALRNEIDGLFYICLAYIRVLGHPLEPAYNLEMLPSGELQLRHYPHAMDHVLRGFSGEGSETTDNPHDEMEMMIRDFLPAQMIEEVLEWDELDDF